MEKLTSEQRFWAKVQKTDTCWEWTGRKNASGYGCFWDRRDVLAHRFVYELSVAAIPDRMVLDHICHNRACVNPEHLRLATRKQNAEHRKGPARSNKSSGVRGVTKTGKAWQAQVMHNGRNHYFGTYPTIAEAEAVVLRERAKLFPFAEVATS